MKQRVLNRAPLLAALLILLLIAGGCAAGSDRPAAGGGIVSVGPSNTEILVGLGAGDRIVAVDDYSAGIEGLAEEVLLFDMMTPDVERLLELQPDLVLVAGMTSSQGRDPYAPLAEAGIEVAYIETSETLVGIGEDILAIAELVGEEEAGRALVEAMEEEIGRAAAIGAAIPPEERVRVYVEIAAAPNLYTFGGGVYLDEILTLIGAENIFADQHKWIGVVDESVLAADPQVILTTVDYLPDPVGEILGRTGWDAVSAVRDGRVYQIDTDRSNRPSQNVVGALWEIAELVYPAHYLP